MKQMFHNFCKLFSTVENTVLDSVQHLAAEQAALMEKRAVIIAQDVHTARNKLKELGIADEEGNAVDSRKKVYSYILEE